MYVLNVDCYYIIIITCELLIRKLVSLQNPRVATTMRTK